MYVKCSSLIFCIKLVIVYDTRKKISENCERTDPHPLKKKRILKRKEFSLFTKIFAIDCCVDKSAIDIFVLYRRNHGFIEPRLSAIRP